MVYFFLEIIEVDRTPTNLVSSSRLSTILKHCLYAPVRGKSEGRSEGNSVWVSACVCVCMCVYVCSVVVCGCVYVNVRTCGLIR